MGLVKQTRKRERERVKKRARGWFQENVNTVFFPYPVSEITDVKRDSIVSKLCGKLYRFLKYCSSFSLCARSIVTALLRDAKKNRQQTYIYSNFRFFLRRWTHDNLQLRLRLFDFFSTQSELRIRLEINFFEFFEKASFSFFLPDRKVISTKVTKEAEKIYNGTIALPIG